MADHLTPAQRDAIDATVARVHRERADAPTMAARYDEACFRIGEMHDEIVKLRRKAESLEDQLVNAQQLAKRSVLNGVAAMERRDTEITRLQKLADRRWVAWQSARRRHVRQRDALREAMAADRDLVRRVRDRYRRERDAARREADADRARILGIVNRWVEEADNGVSDHGDLCDDLRAAGYTLPTTDEEETDR
ncbi:hypothetical protein [Nocardiopsis alba]|uniref:hypothetical protein n=1 Tax=Nocardiopsis alba TaxID=53437 RepID=UPI003D746CEC